MNRRVVERSLRVTTLPVAGLTALRALSVPGPLLGRRGRYATAFRIAAHPLYHFVRRAIRRQR